MVVAAPARGQSVRVQARTTLWVEIDEEDGQLRGWLAEDSGRRLANKTIEVAAGGSTHEVTTDRRGEFELELPGGLGERLVTVNYEGSDYHRPSSLERRVDPSRLPVELQLVVPTVLVLDAPQLEVQVLAERNGHPLSLPVEVVDPNSRQVLASGETGNTGWSHLSFDARILGHPGPHELHARFTGSPYLAPALGRAETLLVDVPALSLGSERTALLPEQRLQLRGTLVGVFAPLTGQEVTIEADGRTLKHVNTSPAGSFETSLEAAELPVDEPSALVARYRSNSLTRRSAVSPPVEISVVRPQPLSLEQLLVPAIATALLLLIILLITRRRTERGSQEERQRSSLLPVETGLRPSHVPTRSIRRPEHHDLTGRVWDPVEERGIPEATIKVKGPAGTSKARASSAGKFALTELPRGPLRIEVEAPAYMSEAFDITLPHDGRYHEVTIQMVQIRHRALEVYRQAARPLLTRTSAWGRWTPREVAIHVARAHPDMSDEVVELTSFFEDMYYSPKAGDEG